MTDPCTFSLDMVLSLLSDLVILDPLIHILPKWMASVDKDRSRRKGTFASLEEAVFFLWTMLTALHHPSLVIDQYCFDKDLLCLMAITGELFSTAMNSIFTDIYSDGEASPTSFAEFWPSSRIEVLRDRGWCPWEARHIGRICHNLSSMSMPVSYTHLTLPTKRIV